ncbi:GNAT family N-acetyltransferase [Citrobacter portucalensis]|uniref:GNAT family N-acetyltransferase n=3 Tax=Citrobacter portucalensis TaxID=1639133 RepID=A0A5B0T6E1_9ENTR|nr:GNAT family N-acetyltransferase [Citrobacter portucalensis]MBJ8675118.1 GNAT family N-acetyltransferase [Citrobacter freundii]MBJ9083577.1 GNAT family N-acetyltransferase [Citrobacter freundii]MBJ9285351.1 GNAT family N-acetyltransferase [Citrobacter freundii]QRQ72804.1 GNAT family N-acetyltransferase [Citrobacter sp. B72]
MPEINLYGQTVGDVVPDWNGAAVLPRETLIGQYCRLVPLDADSHAADLFDAYAQAPDDRDWTWLASSRPTSVEAAVCWVQGKSSDASLVPYAVIEQRSGRAVGLVCFMAIEREHGSVEIGHVTWSPRMKNTVLGTESIWLLLRQAFALGYRRVEWKCDSLNTASRRAAERLGFIFEGRFRQKIVRKGRNRDSDWLSMIDSEWPQCDAVLQRWLAAENFDENGRQRQSMAECFSCETANAETVQMQQQGYQQRWQQEHGSLTQTPPALLADLLAAQPRNPNLCYDTLSSRAGLAALTKANVSTSEPMAAIINTEVDTGERRIPVRIYRPALTGEPKVVLFIHGGGHLSGSVEVYDPVARHLAMATGNIVVSVDYRLAPENPYPAGLSDAKAVIENVWSLLESQHIPYTRQLTLIGDSGGGAFSATLAAYFSREQPGFIHRLVLIYPSLDYTLNWPSVQENGAGKLLDESKIRWYFQQYFRNGEDRKQTSPLYLPLSQDFPPTLVVSGGLDPLRDENFAFVARLQAERIPVQHVHFPGMTHAYLMLEDKVPQEAKATYLAIGDFVKK